jgi:hypothetical protein
MKCHGDQFAAQRDKVHQEKETAGAEKSETNSMTDCAQKSTLFVDSGKST